MRYKTGRVVQTGKRQCAGLHPAAADRQGIRSGGLRHPSAAGTVPAMDPRPSLAAIYDAMVDEREDRGEPEWRLPAQERFVDRLGLGARLLEVGSGVGYAARWFTDRGLDVTASDLSPGNVAKIREKGVPAEVVDLSALPFDDASFDGVWAASCLMHIPNADLPATLEGIRRVLVPGGWFWAGTWGVEESAEGIWAEDRNDPPRFYSVRSDAEMEAFYRAVFEVVSFEATRPEEEFAWHYQWALLRAPD